MEKFPHIVTVNMTLNLPFTKEEPLQNLPGFGDVVALRDFGQFAIFTQQFIQGVKERPRNLVSDGECFQAGKTGVVEAVNFPSEIAGTEDITIFVYNTAIVRVPVHDIYSDPLLLVTVYVIKLCKFSQLGEIVVSNSFCPEIAGLECIVIEFMSGVGELEEEKLQIFQGGIGIDFRDNPVVIAITDGNGSFQDLSQPSQDQLLLLFYRFVETVGVKKKEIVGYCIAVEENLVIGKGTVCPVAES